MKNCAARSAALLALVLAWSGTALAQSSGPTATPATLSFSYQVGSSVMPAPAKLTVSLPSGVAASTTINAQASSSGWLTVTPTSGRSPLSLTVTVNPTSLTPGSYPGSIVLTTTPATATNTVNVTLLVSNPPSTLNVISNAANYTPPSGPGNGTLTFTYTTGTAWVDQQSELDVISNGGLIPFNVTTANVSAGKSGGGGSGSLWLRLSQQQNATMRSTKTSGVAISGSTVPIWVSLDSTTVQALLPGSYGATVTFAADNAANGTVVVSVNLVVSAGPPQVTTIFPTNVLQGTAVNPVITVNGVNFFSTSVVTISPAALPATGPTCTPSGTPNTVPSQVLSQQVLQATVDTAYAKNAGSWCICVTNPAPPDNPVQVTACTPAAPVDYTFQVIPTTAMAITSVVNAASYLPRATQTGTDPDPLAPPNPIRTSVAPGEIISIFGRNLGPAAPYSATPGAVSVAATLTSGAALPPILNTAGLPVPLLLTIDGTPVTVDFATDPNAGGTELLANVVAFINFRTTVAALGARATITGTNRITLTSQAAGATATVAVLDNAASRLLQWTSGTNIVVTGADAAYPTTVAPDPTTTIQVMVRYWDAAASANVTIPAPIIMVSSNQVNALIPFEIAEVVGTTNDTVSMMVSNGGANTGYFPMIAVNADPGIFTLGGLGTGQAAVLNYDSGAYTINSSKNAAVRGSTIVIYATGLGRLASPLATDAIVVPSIDAAADPVQVTIGGQPAVVSYAGTAPGSIGGMVQINAIVPPTVPTGQAVSLTISGGTKATARRSQAGVTLALK